jgi:thiol-disulfide isomerase/thioredoxin
MRRIACVILIEVVSIAWLAAASCAQAAEAGAAGRPKPEELLRKVADYLAGLPAFSGRVESSVHVQAEGIDNRMDSKMTVRLERPNRLAIVLEEGVMGMTLVTDGKQMTQYVPTINRYTVNEAPAKLEDFGGSGGVGMMGVSGAYLSDNGEQFYKALMEGVTSSEYIGEEDVDGVRCHRCRFVQEDFNWDIWVDAGEQPLVRKIVPDMSKQFAQAEGLLAGAKMEYVVSFKDWNIQPKFTDVDFAFTPPAEAEKVDSLFEGLAGGEDEGPHPLLGEAAPAFNTVSLEDKPIDLSTHVGKDVILLDFWATWCGPCVQAMPEVDKVAEKFADRGLVFYAVNVSEDVETIKEFLKTSEIDVPVAMDADGKITESYGVSGIPQTVLIGKDGRVQVVHVGFSDGLADQLSQQVEDLLAGKDLATAALKEAEDAGQNGEAKSEEPIDATSSEPSAN